jgi:hypothetical protein
MREGAIAPVNTPHGFIITFEMESQRRLERSYTTIEKRLERVINDSNNGMDYDEAMGKLHDLYRAAKKYNFQDLISEIEDIGNQIEESELLRQQEEEEAYRIQEEDDDAREERIARAMNRTEKYPPRPYKTPIQPPPKRGAGVEGGARYRYQPATGQYQRLYSPFAKKFANDIVIRQYDIDDLYTQILLNPADRGPEIMSHFKNDKNVNDDQLDYILSVIDSNQRRKEFYKEIQTPYMGNVDERGPLALEYPDATSQIGSRSRFLPEQNIPTAEENQEEIQVAQFVPRTGNEGIDPFGFDDEGELIPPNPTGAGRMDGYNQCHDCGCDSYRDFNALHELEGGGPVLGRPARIAPDPLENARADRARVLADIASLREQVFQRRVRVAEIEEQRAQDARERNQYLARLADLRDLRDNTRNLFNVVNSGHRDQATVGMYNVTWTRYMRLRDELGQDDNPEFPTNFG